MSEELINQVSAEETAESTVNIDQNKYIVINAPSADKIVSVHEEGGQDGLLPSGGTTGQVVTKKGDKDFDVEWADGGAADYTELENKPSINNVTLEGNKTSSELGLQSTIIKEKSNNPSNGIFNISIDDAPSSEAVSVIFKGNTFPVWQMVTRGDSTCTLATGHRFYSYINGVESINISTGEPIQVDFNSGDRIYNLTYSRFTDDEIVDVESFKNAWYKRQGVPFNKNMNTQGPLLLSFTPVMEAYERNLFPEQVNSEEGTPGWESDPIPVSQNITYYVTSPYTLNYVFLDRSRNVLTAGDVQNAEIIAPSGSVNLRIGCEDHVYDGDICVNVSDPAFNGTYAPFKLVGNIDIYDADVWLGSIEDVRDEYNATTGVLTRRIGERDYQEGDEENPQVLTNGAYTLYVLQEPEVQQLRAYSFSLSSVYNNIILVTESIGALGDVSIKYCDKDFVLPPGDSDINILDFTESPFVSVDEVQTVLSNEKPTFIKYIHNNDPNYALLTLNQSPDGSPIAISYVSFPNMELDLIQLSTLEYEEEEGAVAFNSRYALYPLGMTPVRVSTDGGTLTREQYSKLSYGANVGSAQVVDESNFIYRLCHADSGYYEFSCSYSNASRDYFIRTIKLNTQTLQYTYTIQGYFAE